MLRVATAVSAYPLRNFRYLKLLYEFAKKFELYCFAWSRSTGNTMSHPSGFALQYVLPFKVPKRIMYVAGPFLSHLWINAIRPDVVWLFDTTGPILPLMFKGPLILDIDDPYILLRGERSSLRALNEFRLLHDRRVEAIVVPTEIIRLKFVKLGIDPEKIYVIPNGVDVELFKPTPLPEEPVVLYYGTFQEHRALFLSEVVEHTCRKNTGVKFLLIGDVPSWFKQKMSKLGLTEKVVMPGFIPHDELPKWLVRARVCLLPQDRSLGGRFPSKLIEYMAAGRPIVATDVEESFPVKESGAGLVVPVDPKAMAEATLRILNNATAAKEMAENGVNYATKFDWSLMIKRYVEIFERVV